MHAVIAMNRKKKHWMDESFCVCSEYIF